MQRAAFTIFQIALKDVSRRLATGGFASYNPWDIGFFHRPDETTGVMKAWVSTSSSLMRGHVISVTAVIAVKNVLHDNVAAMRCYAVGRTYSPLVVTFFVERISC